MPDDDRAKAVTRAAKALARALGTKGNERSSSWKLVTKLVDEHQIRLEELTPPGKGAALPDIIGAARGVATDPAVQGAVAQGAATIGAASELVGKIGDLVDKVRGVKRR
jgi:hypothetical protein